MVLDRKSFENLYFKYAPRLMAYAYKFLSDQHLAQDIIQDVYVSFWEKYEGKDSPQWHPLLFAMTRNRCLDSLKHISYLRTIVSSNVNMTEEEERLFITDFSYSRSSDTKLLCDELETEIERVRASMSPRCREVFELSRQEGLKNSEIASRLGISEKAVEKNITTALKLFRKKYPKKGRV